MLNEQEELLKRGKKRAMHLLEKKDYSRKELNDKLVKGEYPEEIIAEIFTYLDSFHYLDDLRVAGNFIRNRKEQKSKRELEYLLKQKGISEEDILVAMKENYVTESGESQEELAIRRCLLKYHVTEEMLQTCSYEEKQKLAAKLYRKGFSGDKIRNILQM
ncbi:MAG: regulatory protein RecX [Lachnospiraceae bacterium]|nr:regulatory protein RecX [Lachnospiraceae bacterium]